jgi:hypothetical protein
MPGKEIKGRSKIANYRHGGDVDKYEELGRVDAERGKTRRGKRNLRDEKRRIIKEIKKGRKRRAR